MSITKLFGVTLSRDQKMEVASKIIERNPMIGVQAACIMSAAEEEIKFYVQQGMDETSARQLVASVL